MIQHIILATVLLISCMFHSFQAMDFNLNERPQNPLIQYQAARQDHEQRRNPRLPIDEDEAEELPRVNRNFRVPGSFVNFSAEDLQTLQQVTKGAVILTLAQTIAKHIGKVNDPSNTFQAKFSDSLQTAAISFIITEAIPLALYFGFGAAKEAFYHLPFEYCIRKKAELEYNKAIEQMKANEAINGNAKNRLQDILTKDAHLLKKNKKHLQEIKEEMDLETDEAKKGELLEIYQTLKSQHLQAQIKHSALSTMSISNYQPYANTIYLETQRAQREASRAA